MTLAIGDGSNDVNMIQEAHVGVAIKGKEGNEAALAADYALLEFKQMECLIFYHGKQWSYNIIQFIVMNILATYMIPGNPLFFYFSIDYSQPIFYGGLKIISIILVMYCFLIFPYLFAHNDCDKYNWTRTISLPKCYKYNKERFAQK